MRKNIVITYGTFDLLHYGHILLLKRAKKLGNYLIVGLSSDEFNALKGKKSYFNFNKRKELIKSLKFVDKVITENTWEQKIADIIKYKVNTFVIGDDWKGKFDYLKEYCNVYYLPRTKNISSTLIKNILQNKKENKNE